MKKDIRYVPTPHLVVDAMLSLADFGPSDTLYDLGSGDGRLVLAAARLGGRGVGIEIDGSLVERSRDQAQSEGLSHLVEFRQQSFFQADLRPASVVSAYLLHKVNLALRPKMLEELSSGSRLVSHSFDMDDWVPEQQITVECKWVFLWTIP